MRNATATVLLLASLALGSQSSQAAVIFDVGSQIATAGVDTTVTVPITVQNFNNLWGAQFTLHWDDAVLTSPVVVGLNSALTAGASDGNPDPGYLTWTWFNGAGASVTDNNSIFSVQFSLVGSAGSSTAITFEPVTTDYTPPSVTLSGGDEVFPPDDMTLNAGLVTVVPEPVNVALGIFGFGFAAYGITRLIIRRLQSAQSSNSIACTGQNHSLRTR